MLKCDRCGLRFDEWSADKRLAVLGDGYPMGTLIAVCPQCGCDDIDVVYDDEEDDDMSVSLYAWTEACDHRACVGDCDLCDFIDEQIADEDEGLYPCDPSKNKNCRKTFCYINGGDCMMTTHKEFRRDER